MWPLTFATVTAALSCDESAPTAVVAAGTKATAVATASAATTEIRLLIYLPLDWWDTKAVRPIEAQCGVEARGDRVIRNDERESCLGRLRLVQLPVAEPGGQRLGVVHAQHDAAELVPGEVEHDCALSVVDVEERPPAVLAEAAALRRPERRRRESDPATRARPGGSVRPIETKRIVGVRDAHDAASVSRARRARRVADDERVLAAKSIRRLMARSYAATCRRPSCCYIRATAERRWSGSGDFQYGQWRCQPVGTCPWDLQGESSSQRRGPAERSRR